LDLDLARRRIAWRATHRGTREADMLIGGFAEKYVADWGAAEITWFEDLLAETDVDIMAWAFGKQPPPARYNGPLMQALIRLDYIDVPK
jgi:antitoxin CptB